MILSRWMHFSKLVESLIIRILPGRPSIPEGPSGPAGPSAPSIPSTPFLPFVPGCPGSPIGPVNQCQNHFRCFKIKVILRWIRDLSTVPRCPYQVGEYLTWTPWNSVISITPSRSNATAWAWFTSGSLVTPFTWRYEILWMKIVLPFSIY